MTVNELGKQLEDMSNNLKVSDLQNKKLNDYNKQL